MENIDFNNKNYTLTKKGIKVDIELSGKCYDKKIFSSKIKALLDVHNLDILEKKIKTKKL